MRIVALACCFLMALLAGSGAAGADGRVALVIGNGAYQHVPLLPNPTNDAGDVSATLTKLGFAVATLRNAKYDDMRRALIEFGRQSRGAELAIIFFAGHGLQIGGENWLIPTDAKLLSDIDVPNEAIGLQSLTRAVSSSTKLGLVILDACRNNPFLQKMQLSSATRAVERGFARSEPTDNVLVAYSARDGTTTKDGAGRNSPFTASLLRNIETPGLEVRFLFANIRDEVLAATNREQQPFIYGSLSKEQIYIAPREARDAPATGLLTKEEDVFWNVIKDSGVTALYEQYLARFPNGSKVNEARARISANSQDLDSRLRELSTAVNRQWTTIFSKFGRTFPEVKIIPSDMTKSCSPASTGAAAVYCPKDRQIFLDLKFLRTLEARFSGCGDPCQLAEAYVVAHAAGHHIQEQLGILARVDKFLETSSVAETNRLLLQFELQADCLAGVWLTHESKANPKLFPNPPIPAALEAASHTSNQLLSHKANEPVPDSLSHGSPAQRMEWFMKGYRDGSVAICNTFSAEASIK